MIKRNNIKIPLQSTKTDYLPLVASALHLPPRKLRTVQLYKKSVDVRKKSDPHYCCTFLVELINPADEQQLLLQDPNALPFTEQPYRWPSAQKLPVHQPVIIGSGPAGLFAALTLARAGVAPLIIEQGQPVPQRTKTVEDFWRGGKLNPHSNVQFGEGGAGTFSDGKLNTGIKDPRIRTVLNTFYEFGASADILTNAKPHIGTDVLRRVVLAMREEITRLGGTYLFETTLEDLIINRGKITGICCRQNGKTLQMNCELLILAAGNAARPLFKMLNHHQIPLAAKAFAVGARIEHLQQELNHSQYGPHYHPALPPCDYKLAAHPGGRGVYTFCMCPGGFVVNATDAPNGYVTNGMSYKARDGKNANAAVLVGITPEDFGNNPLAGIAFQEKIEHAAYRLTNGKGLPVQTLGSFLYGAENQIGRVSPTVLPTFVPADISQVFPKYVTDALRQGLPLFARKIQGFTASDAVLTAPETRSSSPVRILRDSHFETAVQGIFPCGEGAGYAGGITSSAVDGMRCAEQLLEKYC